MSNEKIRTPDIVECRDSKILTLNPHPALDVTAGENYDSVTTKIEARVLSPEQKEAFDATLSVPSALNPVVLKNDLAEYIHHADLGEIKDSVPTYLDLPTFPSNELGDLRAVIADNIIYRWAASYWTFPASAVDPVLDLITVGSHGLTAGQPLTVETSDERYPQPLTGFTAYYVVNPTTNTFQLSTTLSGAALDLTTQGSGTHMVVFGGAWQEFIRSGTLDHTKLLNQDGDPLYLHMSSSQKSLLLSETHTHTNKPVLDSITDAGSGQIITSAERSRLPTTNQKSALLGTSGTPSASNPYVTNLDPRLNTVRNPYVTIGPPGSLATFQGIDYRPFEDAIQAVDTGSASAVKAIEVLPGFYTLGGTFLQWTSQASALVLEAFSPGSVILSFQTLTNSIQSLDSPHTGKGPLILRGFVIELNGDGTSGVNISRDYCVLENCTFRNGPTPGVNQVGVTLSGYGQVLRKCTFIGGLSKAIVVNGENCRVEECTVDLTDPSKTALEVTSSYLRFDHNTVLSGILTISSASSFTGLYNNYFDPSVSLTDNGQSTRFLENQPGEINQPYVGSIRTVTQAGSFGDFRGNDETPIQDGLADPRTQVITINPGMYTLGSVVTVPSGKTLIASAPGVILIGNITLAGDNTGLYGIEVQGLVTVGSGKSGVKVQDCMITSGSGSFGIETRNPVDFRVTNTKFLGLGGGINLIESTRTKIQGCQFFGTLAGSPLNQDALCTFDSVIENLFEGVNPTFRGGYHVVEGNEFQTAPDKTGTASSIFWGNWPELANNDDGVDILTLSLSDSFEPISGSCTRSTIVTSSSSLIGSIAYPASLVSSAGTTPVALTSTLEPNQTYTVDLWWTSQTGVTGDVVFQVTVCFRDRPGAQVGTAFTQSLVSSRTGAQEDNVQFSFTNDYGLGGTLPSHVSVIVERLGTSIADTLTGTAHLLEAQITLARN